VTLLYFGYTRCPDQCPITLADIAMALRRTTAAVRKEVRVVFVSIDPGYDTPDRLGDYLRRYDRGFVGLTGSAKQVRAAQRAAGVPQVTAAQANEANAASPAHGSGVLVYARDDQAHWVFPPYLPVGDIRHDLPMMVERSAHPHS
jgi:protein SCO1/2